MKKPSKKHKGFTLLEMLLVLAIMSGIMVMLFQFVNQRTEETRRDRLILQIQQILSAGLSFYVNNGYWPTGQKGQCSNPFGLNYLKPDYLPESFNLNPYGKGFSVLCNSISGTFSVMTDLPNLTEAKIIASRLPISRIDEANNRVFASVTIPGQNLNNARGINFGNLYRPGGCVPAPTCPNPAMKPQIIVVPVSVSGLNDKGSPRVYPISSFTAYAYGKPGNPPSSEPVKGDPAEGGPARCTAPTTGEVCKEDVSIDSNTYYWRVCLNVITAKGNIAVTNPEEWAKNLTVLAVTRCAPPKEPTGSTFEVFEKPAVPANSHTDKF